MAIESAQLDQIVATANITVTFDDVAQQVRSFKTFRDMKEFFQGELEFWTPYSGGGLSNIYGNFSFVVNELNQAAMQPSIDHAGQLISQVANRLQQQRLGFVYSQTPLAHFLTSLAAKRPELARGALSYYDGTFGQPPLTSSREYLAGIIAAIAFRHPDFFTAGLDARVKAFDQQASELSALRDRLSAHYQALQQNTEEWRNTTQASIS